MNAMLAGIGTFGTVKRANDDASVIVFRDNITFIEHEGEVKELKA